MAKFYSVKDRVKITVGKVEVLIKPLTVQEKTEIQNTLGAVATVGVGMSYMGAAKAIAYSVKGLKGVVVDEEGTEFELEKDDNGNLTDDCVSDLLNIPIGVQLTNIAMNLLNGLSDKITDNQGKPIKGIKIVGVEKGKK